MQIKPINTAKPEITFHKSGLIEVTSRVSRKLNLTEDSSKIAFVIDDEKDVYILKSDDGIAPSSSKGNFHRYNSIEVTHAIFSHPDIPPDYIKVSFRTGDIENGLLPIITRRIVKNKLLPV